MPVAVADDGDRTPPEVALGKRSELKMRPGRQVAIVIEVADDGGAVPESYRTCIDRGITRFNDGAHLQRALHHEHKQVVWAAPAALQGDRVRPKTQCRV